MRLVGASFVCLSLLHTTIAAVVISSSYISHRYLFYSYCYRGLMLALSFCDFSSGVLLAA